MIVSLKPLVAYKLLIQTLSHTRKESNTFIPIVQNTYIQQRVKQLYHQVIESNQVSNTIDEIYLLFENLNNKYNHTFLSLLFTRI